MDISEAIRMRRSVRKYASKAIAEDVMRQMKQALRLAPSACNFQPWHFVLVQDEQLRREVAEASNGQMWMARSPGKASGPASMTFAMHVRYETLSQQQSWRAQHATHNVPSDG